jgi:hypothetical protein
MSESSEKGLVSGPPHEPGAPTAATPPEPEQGDSACDHDWTVVNRDENRVVHKCTKCGALRRE